MAESFIYLASASPRRQALLRQIGIDFETVVTDVPETPQPREAPEEYVIRLAREKAAAGARLVTTRGLTPRAVLGADTAVVVDGEILGKPIDRAHGLEMLRRLSGRTHEVLTAIALWCGTNLDGRVGHSALSRSRVTFAALDEQTIAHYWDSGEPADKAGGYAIQGRAGAFVTLIEGSYSGIVGLPLFELSTILRQLRVNGL